MGIMLILLISSVFNYQRISSILTFSENAFYEDFNPVPSFSKYSWIDFAPSYTLISFGKTLELKNAEAGISIHLKRGDSTLYPTKLWNNLFAADYNALYLRYSVGAFDLIVGRIPVKWSPSPLSSLIFTGYEPGIDLFYYSITKEPFKLDYFFSPLYDNKPLRYLAAHRLLFRPSENIQLSFRDIILYKTSSNAPDFYYFNPFAIYYLRQWALDSSGLTNSIFDFTGELKRGNFHLYGELLIDDFPYIKVYHENPRMGVLGGIVYRKNNFSILAEYVRVNRFTYCYYTFAPYMGYRYFNMPLGHINGNDFDRIALVSLKRTGWGELGLKIAYLRHGEGTLDETYRSTSEESEHYFLSGVVEKRFSISPFIVLMAQKYRFFINPTFFHIKNHRNIPLRISKFLHLNVCAKLEL